MQQIMGKRELCHVADAINKGANVNHRDMVSTLH